ncbi:MAG: serine hydrolase domain-containing protein [Trueperaceae bacterium]|nr:serine hydrolase domain-containing protein [Trueperaceae bacterium]
MLEPITSLITDAVHSGVVPGAVVVVGDRDRWDVVAASGVLAYASLAHAPGTQSATPVRPDSRYDLASLTKVVATLPSVLALVSAGEVRLEDRLEHFFSNAGWGQSPSLADVTVAQLLSHTAGLAALSPLYTVTDNRRTGLAYLLQSARPNVGACVYSDVGYMLLGALVERVSGRGLERFARDHVFGPLGMAATDYGPVPPDNVAATEDCGWRGRLLQGEVHDENAFALGGVAGHAGLFGPAEDLARYARAWLRLELPFASPELAASLLVHQGTCSTTGRRSLGWQLHSPDCIGGRAASPASFGHSGFTGTSVWIDPEQGWFTVLLTNRVHPSRRAGAGIHALRRAVHEVVARAFTPSS